jgi:hypothetical protein
MSRDIGFYIIIRQVEQEANSLHIAVAKKAPKPNQRVKQFQHLQTKDAPMPREPWVALRGLEKSTAGPSP